MENNCRKPRMINVLQTINQKLGKNRATTVDSNSR